MFLDFQLISTHAETPETIFKFVTLSDNFNQKITLVPQKVEKDNDSSIRNQIISHEMIVTLIDLRIDAYIK